MIPLFVLAFSNFQSYPTIDPIESATVLVGAISPSSKGETFGTGFIVDYKSQAYVVSCKHVISESRAKELFAIPRPQKTKSPANGYRVIHLGRPQFHPKDGIDETFDIAVMKVLDFNREEFKKLGINPICLQKGTLRDPENGLIITAAGYPVAYTEKELAYNISVPLLPLQLQGTIRSLPQSQNISEHGFIGKLFEYYVADMGGQTTGKGFSGGLVYTRTESNSINIVGMVLGQLDTVIKNNGLSSNFKAAVFAKTSRIIEAIEQ